MRRLALLAGLLLLLGAPAAASGYVVADSGAWCWFGDPRAVYHDGDRRQTYVGWIDARGAIRVASFDHDSRRVDSVAIQEGLAVDDHSNPSLYVRRDGRLIAFWSAHHNGALYYRVTDLPEDVTSWGPLQQLHTNTRSSPNYTYPNPLRIRDGLFLFWRGGGLKPAFSISRDEGASWSSARMLIQSQGWRPYVKYETSGRDTIHFAFTEDHPGDAWGGSLTGIHYASYRAGAFYRADGTRIATMASLPLTPSQADRVYDPTPSGVRAWIHDIATVNGRPVIVYATLPSAGDHRYRYARWTGRAWEDREIVAAGGSFEGSGSQPGYSGGIVLDHEDPATVYLSRKVLGRFEIERWRTRDGGKSWSSGPITSGSAKDNVRPFTPRGSTSDDLDVFWMHGDYPDFTHFQTSLLARTSRRELALGRGRLRLGRRNTVDVRLRCLAGAGSCEGTVVMRTARKVRLTRGPNLRPRVVRLGSTRFRVHAGRRGEAQLRLSMRAAALVRRRGQIPVRLRAAGRTRTGTKYSRGTTALLTARRQRSRQ